MRAKNTNKLLLWAFLPAIFLSPARAVIVAGTLGTGNNNATKAGLDAYLSSVSGPMFSYWDNQIRVSDASGVYLGYNPSTMRGWVLSANHVTTPTAITVAGKSYSVGAGYQIGTSDLKLYQIGGAVSDPALPISLPAVNLASSLSAGGEFSLMFGRGSTNSSSAPYTWVAPGTDPANSVRWASNIVEFRSVHLGNEILVTDFDSPFGQFRTDYDGQGALGDSGGGLFVWRNGSWELAGITWAVNSTASAAAYGDLTYFSGIFSQASAIRSITGTLVPEPTTPAYLLTVLMAVALQRRRANPRQ
jgi:hypothetical protein